ncbi:MAG TPA: STAS domain-containing protein [Ignavibacteriaceae bacterium]|nr:STAS domain-containing protein [Ignavibacteriaceae bacterium]
MDFNRETQGEIVIHTINLQRATYKEAESFRKAVMDDIVEGKRKFIVDLFICEYLDSTFLGTLISLTKTLMQFGGEIKLVVFTADAQILLEKTRVVQIFDTYKTKEDAVANFEKGKK